MLSNRPWQVIMGCNSSSNARGLLQLTRAPVFMIDNKNGKLTHLP